MRFPEPTYGKGIDVGNANALVFQRKFIQDCRGVILLAVIDCDDFKIGIIDGCKRGECRRQFFLFISRRKNQ